MRLTKRTESGAAVLDRAAFPEYAQETLIREVSAFSPLRAVVEKLCAYEEAEKEYDFKCALHNA